ncbi:Cytoplasmic tRNA 2-thiolation protein 2 [Saitoella coloradoensis]
MDKPSITAICKKCKKNPGAIVVRYENLCNDCFTRYVQRKFLRHMAKYREGLGADEGRKFMVCYSGGVGSTGLLDMVGAFYNVMERNEKSPRAVDGVLVVHVDESEIGEESIDDTILNEAGKRCQGSQVVRIPLSHVFDLLPSSITYTWDPQTQSLRSSPSHPPSPLPPTERFNALISSLPSPSSRSDLRAYLRTKLINNLALRENCSTILYGDSGTRSAAKILGLTASGRGHTVPYEIGDAVSSTSTQAKMEGQGEERLAVDVVRPLKDLLQQELESYLALHELTYVKSEIPELSNVKNYTIDQLMTRYFRGLEITFPSIVATVGRTAEKLGKAVESKGEAGRCRICGMPAEKDVKKWIERLTVNEPAPLEEIENSLARMQIANADAPADARKEDDKDESDVTSEVCYGCLAATRHAKAPLPWPVESVQGRANDTQSVLDKYLID